MSGAVREYEKGMPPLPPPQAIQIYIKEINYGVLWIFFCFHFLCLFQTLTLIIQMTKDQLNKFRISLYIYIYI